MSLRPPAFPLAPKEYTQEYMDVFRRILTQYLNQASVDAGVVKQEADVQDVITWLGGW
jgi:hypothetical protein